MPAIPKVMVGGISFIQGGNRNQRLIVISPVTRKDIGIGWRRGRLFFANAAIGIARGSGVTIRIQYAKADAAETTMTAPDIGLIAFL